MDNKEQQPTTEISTETTPWDDLATETPETTEVIDELPEPPEPRPTLKNFKGVEQIQNSEGLIVGRDQLHTIIETPCLPACISLYDKNIQTLSSSANKNICAGDPAFIALEYRTLSEENKAIVQEMIDEGIIPPIITDEKRRGAYYAFIKVKVTDEDTVESVSDKFMEITSRFKEQDVLYGHYDAQTAITDAIKKYFEFYPEDANGDMVTYVRKENGEIDYVATLHKVFGEEEDAIKFTENWYGAKYDKETDAFWKSEELLEKHKKYVAEHPEAK